MRPPIAISATTRTPVRASAARSRTPSTALSTSQRVRPSPTATREAVTRTVPSTAIRKKPGLQSAIPVPTTARHDARTLSRPTSSAETAATRVAGSGLRSISSSGRRQEQQQAGLGVGAGRPRPSGASTLAASQSSRKSSWETVRSARNSLASSRRKSSIARLSEGDDDEGEEPDQLKTPRKRPLVAPATLVSPPSPRLDNQLSSLDKAISPGTDPTELFGSHAAFLSPLPPPPVNLLDGQGSKTRARPRESTTLEEILRLGMLNNQASVRRRDAPSLELELLLDEGTSRVMTDELRNSLGGGGQGGGDSPVASSSTTPWRGRVVSLGGSATRRSVGGLDPLAEDESKHLSSPKQTGQVLLLRQSTAEASDLRRQVAALTAQLDELKRLPRVEPELVIEQDVRADRRLLDELEAARKRETDLRADWEAERQAMEQDMAELAAAAAASSTARDATAPIAVAPLPTRQDDPSERIRQRADACMGTAARLAATCSEVQALAKREREDGRLAIASLQAIARGLEVWGTTVLV